MRTHLCLLASLLAGGVLAADQSFTYTDLVSRLTDLEQVAILPEKGERCDQWSSYDRKSKYNEATGKFEAWDANGDGDGIIRKEGEQLVMAEMEGPGCIWRIWSALPTEGHVRIYLDGASEPAVDLPFRGYFDGKNEPFTRPALVHMVARGWNNYTPIPYQKSCKIVADPKWGSYFQFNYTTYPKGTKVPTFKRELSEAEKYALDKADRIWTERGARVGSNKPAAAGEARVANGQPVRVKLKGPTAVSCLRVRVESLAPSQIEALRSLAVQIRWDGEQEPSVWAPLGDFFGTAPGLNRYDSLPMGISRDGWMYCNWHMPFARSAEITLVQDGSVPLDLEYEVYTVKLSQPAEKYGRFHAKWHRDALLPPEPERWIDWTILKTEGAGRFVGVMLHIWNPRGGWWGEGDEKFHVDGEKFPSTIGTGSEDYFGYAWCDPALFQNAYHNQTRNDGNNKGHVSVNRWQISDNIPFSKSFEGYIEKYYGNQRPTLYAGMAYWYLEPGGKDPYRPAALTERVNYWNQPVISTRVKDALEGESLKILRKTGGETEEQDLTGFGDRWSNDAHLWWKHAQPGSQLELEVPVAKAGLYELKAHMTKAPDYGIIQLYLDGQKLGQPIDFYNTGVIPTGVISLGKHELKAGAHKLTAEVVGANEKAIKSHMFGLDYLKLELSQ